MDSNFWQQKWHSGDIAFHEGETNALLKQHFKALMLAPEKRIFLPLCGKSRDVAWLLNKGFSVVGAELSEMAIKFLFDELNLKPTITNLEGLILYQAPNLDMYVGDIFNVSAQLIGQVDGVYDRGALVALPNTMRTAYCAHVIKVTNNAPQLIITYEYNQALMAGPPFSITEEEISLHYKKHYQLECIEQKPVEGKLKNAVNALETLWVLYRREV